MTGCPYKKMYFNHKTGKVEKCTFCYPRIELGQPTICSETCVGRLRYLGLMLYDADRVLEAASTPDEHGLYEAQREVFLDPNDPEVVREALAAGIPEDWIDAARRSPIRALINDYKVALPLHPEYRTMPMVWCIPPLSPVVDAVSETGEDGERRENLFAAIDRLRIPIEYLAGLFTAGDTGPVDGLDAGESIRGLAEYLGHADPGFTLRVYTHLVPASEERTKRAVDQALRGQCWSTARRGVHQLCTTRPLRPYTRSSQRRGARCRSRGSKPL